MSEDTFCCKVRIARLERREWGGLEWVNQVKWICLNSQTQRRQYPWWNLIYFTVSFFQQQTKRETTPPHYLIIWQLLTQNLIHINTLKVQLLITNFHQFFPSKSFMYIHKHIYIYVCICICSVSCQVKHWIFWPSESNCQWTSNIWIVCEFWLLFQMLWWSYLFSNCIKYSLRLLKLHWELVI